MVEFYVCEAPTLLETMRAALAEQNRRKLVSAECRLRKTLVHLAARPAMEAAERLEQRVIEGQWVERTELLAELTYHLERLDAALRASLARNSKLL
jgi:HPt (histidine-containing phosphotransfer) domain-containing protein